MKALRLNFCGSRAGESIGLGPRILRAETAAVAGTAVIMALSGCMGYKNSAQKPEAEGAK